eukprot:TRINITY_DN500_c0_g1_i1.p2 TRINITY_DN500_c0_g1~~TRINITY_DN500_c0_g1_i1.p2  ORF type:complete len:139 (+),score=5.57 TRINITY_DN500_c0_g1_i1:61-477(+)
MANASSGMNVSGDCIETFMELKRKKTYRFVVFKIENNVITVETKGPPTATYKDFQASLPENDCRYAVYDHDFVTEDNCQKSKIFFIAWSPDTSRVRVKMTYASSKDTFRRQLDGVHFELQATDPSEMDIDVINERSLK